jgi:iron(III) transport system permease protein
MEATEPANDNWHFIQKSLLTACLYDTVLVTVLGTLGAAAIGVTLAWVTSIYDFPGKRFLEWSLVLPLAIPPYISAYIYYHVIGYTGAFQTVLRALDINVYRLGLSVSPMALAVFVFSVTLFPYVYLIIKAFLRHQSGSIYENARLLSSPWRGFFLVFLPLMWPSIAAGSSLAAMEILSDFGVSSHFGLSTFSVAIFQTWFGMSDAVSATKLSVILLAVVLAVTVVLKLSQRTRKYHIASSREKTFFPQRPKALTAWLCTLICLAVQFVALVIPLAQLLGWLTLVSDPWANPKLWTNVFNTVSSALTATVITLILALGTIYAFRLKRTKTNRALTQAAGLGYSVPGAVLAMGVISLFAFVNSVGGYLGTDGLINVSRAVTVLIFAYIVRFLAIGLHSVDSGWIKIGFIYGEAARTLGAGPSKTFFLIELPMIKNAVLSGSVLVFLDIVKELPLTLILRPFNFNTLGTSVYDFAKNEILERMAPSAILIIVICAAFIFLAAALNKPRRSLSKAT